MRSAVGEGGGSKESGGEGRGRRLLEGEVPVPGGGGEKSKASDDRGSKRTRGRVVVPAADKRGPVKRRLTG